MDHESLSNNHKLISCLNFQLFSYWNNIDKIDNLEHLRQMEESLRESINRVGLQKVRLLFHAD